MIHHILVPLDGSELAECVLPHLMAIAPITGARVTLIHVLERNLSRNGSALPFDLLGWHMQKQESQSYLDRITERLQQLSLEVEQVIVEGNPAETIIEFARSSDVDLVLLSSHGRTGLSEWNMSSVVQKILLGCYKSILLIRAFANPSADVQYKRLFLALDGSPRAEFILPFAMSLAQAHQSNVMLGMVIQKPQTMQRLPLSDEDAAWLQQFTERNQNDATRYLDQLATQLALKSVASEVKIVVADNTLGAVYDMAEESETDLIVIAAHGSSGERRWPYGSIASNLIAYGHTPLMILQDLSEGEIPSMHANRSVRDIRER